MLTNPRMVSLGSSLLPFFLCPLTSMQLSKHVLVHMSMQTSIVPHVRAHVYTHVYAHVYAHLHRGNRAWNCLSTHLSHDYAHVEANVKVLSLRICTNVPYGRPSGLHGYGLYSDGLYGYALYSYGRPQVHTIVPETACTQAYIYIYIN